MNYAIINEFCANKPHRLRRTEAVGGRCEKTYLLINYEIHINLLIISYIRYFILYHVLDTVLYVLNPLFVH